MQVHLVDGTYTALTFSDRNTDSNTLLYAEGFDEQHTPVEHMPAAEKYTAIDVDELDTNGTAWTLTSREARKFLQRTRTHGRPLLEVADVRFGVATLRDNLYLLDGTTDTDGFLTKTVDSETFRIEPAATVAAVKVPDVTTRAALRRHRGRILFPYTRDRDGRAVIWTEDELAQHPQARRYLEAIREELAKRDNGTKTYADWYAYGRTQGLSAWHGERLLTPMYAAAPRFIRDESTGRGRNRIFLNGCSVRVCGQFHHCGGTPVSQRLLRWCRPGARTVSGQYLRCRHQITCQAGASPRRNCPQALTPKDDSNMSVELLEALLNSTTLQFFIEQTSAALNGGYYSYQKGPLSGFHVLDEIITRSDEVIGASETERNALIADIYEVQLPDRYLNSPRHEH